MAALLKQRPGHIMCPAHVSAERRSEPPLLESCNSGVTNVDDQSKLNHVGSPRDFPSAGHEQKQKQRLPKTKAKQELVMNKAKAKAARGRSNKAEAPSWIQIRIWMMPGFQSIRLAHLQELR